MLRYWDAASGKWKRFTLSSTVSVDVIDKAIREVGVVYGSQDEPFQQRASTYELLVQLAHAGVEINPQTIRALTSTDEITVHGDQGKLAQRATTKEALIDLIRVGGTAQTGRDIALDLKTLLDAYVSAAAAHAVVGPGGDKLFSVESVVYQFLGAIPTTDSYTMNFTAVPSGKIQVITLISAVDNAGTGIKFDFRIMSGGVVRGQLETYVTTATAQVHPLVGWFPLEACENVTIIFTGVNTHEIYGTIRGFQMDA